MVTHEYASGMSDGRPQPDPEELWRSGTRPVVLVEHDRAWAAMAASESRAIVQACREAWGSLVLRVEHIGSTSVPGLMAKPVIDLMPLVRSFEEGFACVEPIRKLGYWYGGEFGIAGRHLFIKGDPRTHHVHMLVDGSREAVRHLAVRDSLRKDPELARRYAELKLELQKRFSHDRQGFSDAKAEFMREIFGRAGVE